MTISKKNFKDKSNTKTILKWKYDSFSKHNKHSLYLMKHSYATLTSYEQKQ